MQEMLGNIQRKHMNKFPAGGQTLGDPEETQGEMKKPDKILNPSMEEEKEDKN